MFEKDPHRYDDIIDLPHFVSKARKHMSNYDRAAQFSPFDALTGYSEAIDETGRTTDNEVSLGESEIRELDLKFRMINRNIARNPKLKIRYFVPDPYKDGGSYLEEEVIARKIDLNRRILISEERKEYDLDYITDVDAEIFESLDF